MNRTWGELETRGGALVDAAARFVASAGLSGSRGASGLDELASSIEAHAAAEPGPDEAERAFLDGAGAQLGMLLLDALGGRHRERRGAHRIALGPYGFFDPFAAVERSVDAERPRRELARAVARAEAEAASTGPLARVARAFVERLPTTDACRVVDHFEFDIRLANGMEVNLLRAVRATEELGAESVARSAEKLVALVTESSGTVSLPWEDLAPRVLPRVVAKAFLDELAVRGARPLLSSPYRGGLAVAYVLAHGDRSRFVRAAEASDWRVSTPAIHARAIENLASRSARARIAEVVTAAGSLAVARTGDGLDAARILLPTLRDVLAPLLGPRIVAAIPHRDTLLAAPADNPLLVETLRVRATEDAARAPHRITAALLPL